MENFDLNQCSIDDLVVLTNDCLRLIDFKMRSGNFDFCKVSDSNFEMLCSLSSSVSRFLDNFLDNL